MHDSIHALVVASRTGAGPARPGEIAGTCRDPHGPWVQTGTTKRSAPGGGRGHSPREGARAHARLPVVPIFLLALLLGAVGCTISPEYTISFVTVREKDFRLGPLPLPLDGEGKAALLSFLEKGGDHGIDDYVDAGAEHHHGELLELLSRPDFLHSANFRKEEMPGEIADGLTRWFHKPIIYQLIDARHDTPVVPRPMCMTDGQYWWIFDNDVRIYQLEPKKD